MPADRALPQGSFLLTFAWMLLVSGTALAQTTPGWVGNLNEAQRLAAESGKPIFVVFRCER